MDNSGDQLEAAAAGAELELLDELSDDEDDVDDDEDVSEEPLEVSELLAAGELLPESRLSVR